MPDLWDLQSWTDRTVAPLRRKHDITDYPDYHVAKVRCIGCNNTAIAVYPPECNVLRMECPECGTRESEIVRYIKRVWKQ